MLTERQFERSDKLSAEQVKSVQHELELVFRAMRLPEASAARISSDSS